MVPDREFAVVGLVVACAIVAYALIGAVDLGFFFYRIAFITGTLLGFSTFGKDQQPGVVLGDRANGKVVTTIPVDVGGTPGLHQQRYLVAAFKPDSKAVAYPIRESGVDNLWAQPLDGASGRRITSFNAEQISTFAWSPDGKSLAILRGHTDSDVVLIRDTSR